MPSLNNIQIMGHLGQDPELRFTPNGNAVVGFSVAVDDKYGEKKETIWFAVTAWNKQAELCNEWLSKGDLVYVEGRLRVNTWESESGEKRTRVEINARRVLFIKTKKSALREIDESRFTGTEVDTQHEEILTDDLPF